MQVNAGTKHGFKLELPHGSSRANFKIKSDELLVKRLADGKNSSATAGHCEFTGLILAVKNRRAVLRNRGGSYNFARTMKSRKPNRSFGPGLYIQKQGE
jgi:hypothetical protein